MRDRGHKPSSWRDNFGGVHTIIVHDDLAEAAHIQDVVVIQRAAAKLGVDGEAVAADALSEKVAVLFRAIAKPAHLQAAAVAFQGAHAVLANLLRVVLELRLALLNRVGQPWRGALLAQKALLALAAIAGKVALHVAPAAVQVGGA